MKYLRLAPFTLVSGLSVFSLAACSDSPAPVVNYKPLDYSYLPPIRLTVSAINVQNNYVPDPGAATLLGQDPEPPANAVMDMASRRLVANGTPGTATFTVENASIEDIGGNLTGALTVRLDVISADGRAKGYTEATVTHSQTAPDPSDAAKTRGALYDMTKQLMDAMNVQFQYQLQQNLGSWISYSNNAAAAPVISPGGSGGTLGGIQATPLDTPAPGAGPQTLMPPTGVLH